MSPKNIDCFVKNVRLVEFILRAMVLPDKTIKLERAAHSARGYEYPLAEQFLGDDAEGELESLAEHGFLERRFLAQELSCPRCGSIDLDFGFACPICGASTIARQDIFAHAACGHTGPEADFADGVCPNCGQPLGQMGIGYTRDSTQYYCLACRQLFGAPDKKLFCSRDGSTFTVEEARDKKLYNYRLTPRLEEEINKAIDQRQYIRDKIEQLGFGVQSPAAIAGRSGVEQHFWLAARTGVGFWQTRIIVDILDSETVDDVLSLYARAMDVGAKGVIFLASPDIAGDARSVAQSYGMILVEAGDMRAGAERLVEKFTQMVETPEERLAQIYGPAGG